MSLICTETGKETGDISFEDATDAYNELCINVYGGGMCPDERLKEQCPKTHKFFMRFFGYDPETYKRLDEKS